VSAGTYGTCALTTAGGVQCWGSNQNGELGNNATTDSHVPVAVVGLSSGVAAIAAGQTAHNCALTTSGGLLCWGLNQYGQLGNGTTTDSHVPVPVSGLSTGVLAVSAGQEHTCALTGAGVDCWGWNDHGQLGNDSTTNSPVPVPVPGLPSGVLSIAAGGRHTCALTTAGGVHCWGLNNVGQLGNNSTTESHVPVPVSGLSSGVVSIVAGEGDTCAVTTAGAAECWGELGGLVPSAVSGFSSGVAALAAGAGHLCALTTSGGVLCLGSNPSGELGNNSLMNSAVPVSVVGLSSGVVAISAGGGEHNCAVTTTGAVECWGWNLYGQLGNNSTTDALVPVSVIEP
jgi:alpha-tubulin suppressor-like RCC1 family protein